MRGSFRAADNPRVDQASSPRPTLSPDASGMIQKVLTSTALPSLPAVAVRIIELVQEPDVSIDMLTRTLAADPALSARILRTANSGFYGRVRGVTNLRDSIMVLGLRTVRTLALGFSLVSGIRKSEEGGFDHTEFWQRSLLAATGARALARAVNSPMREEAFLTGLLHSIGVLALNQVLVQEYQAVIAASGGDYDLLRDKERQAFGTDHAQLGAELAARWNLPQSFVDGIAHYPDPAAAPEVHQPLARFVAIGADLADVALGAAPGEAIESFRSRCEAWFGLSAEKSREIIESASAEAKALRASFDLPEVRQLDTTEILLRANAVLSEVALEASRENVTLELKTEALEQETVRLSAEASTDPLTGLANRRHFDEFLNEQFRIARRYGRELSLLVLDIDYFKEVNDKHGHRVGDEVLVRLAETIRSVIRDADLGVRFGGDEFAVVLPDTDIDGAAEAGERIRVGIERLKISAGFLKSVKVTVSIGGAAVEAKRTESPGDLLESADNALYKAKETGRNAVRVSRRMLAA